MNTDQKLKRKALAVVAALKERYPIASCSLEYEQDAWKLLVMARLSAQCTDARVNVVSKGLFEAYPTPQALADADLADIEQHIFACGLYHTKAKNIKDMCAILCESYDGRVPDTMEDLLALPGVGRKIANLMLGDVYGKGGIVTDTHCIRIAGRLGLVASKNPLQVERALDQLIPKQEQSDFCHRLVYFGRDVCRAKSPDCKDCPLKAGHLCDGIALDQDR